MAAHRANHSGTLLKISMKVKAENPMISWRKNKRREGTAVRSATLEKTRPPRAIPIKNAMSMVVKA